MYMLHRVWKVWRNLILFTRPLIDAKHLQYVAFIFFFLFVYIYLGYFGGGYTHAMTYVLKSKDNSQESVLCFTVDQIQVVSLDY